jgi:hypothetical protein
MSPVPDPVERLWRSIATAQVDELRELARSATAEPQRVAMRSTSRRSIRPRWAVVVAVVALLLGSGLGFSLGDSVTPSGSAGRNVAGFGFLPERGWKVVQRVGPSPGTATAVASKNGVVLTVTSTPRGDPAEDVAYAVREWPLRVADARRVSTDSSQLALRAGVGGYNIDARLSFGDGMPTTGMLAAAQRQLNRLVIAADKITIAVRPTIASITTPAVTVYGTIDSANAGESITIQAKGCGETFFRAYSGASTEAGGTWSQLVFPTTTMRLRAVWKSATSSEVTVSKRVFVGFRQRAATRFSVYMVGYGNRFVGKYVNIQRFDQRLGRWGTIRKLVLTSDRYGTSFTLRVPKGTRLRAVLPNSEARPCFLGGTSPIRRT